MPTVQLRPLGSEDLPFVGEVRHDPETLRFLHDQRIFSANEMEAWFVSARPEWYVIVSDGQRVGYIRTSDRDPRGRSIKAGADIHPRHRRRGFATSAYRLFFEMLLWQNVQRVWLEVLPENHAAIALYERLGFRHEGRLAGAVRRGSAWSDSLVMGRLLCPDTGRNAKVIALYLGYRRGRPANPREAYDLLRFVLEKEFDVDPGCDADTLLVYNRDASLRQDSMSSWIEKSEELLMQASGGKTARGILHLIARENIGLSFGAYNCAFTQHMTKYDYWLFTEDDQVLVQPGCFSRAIEQLQSDASIGFVAIVGACHAGFPPHAHGGVGVTSRTVLRDVLAANPCERHPRGHLPYHWETGYSGQELNGEIRFTNAIHQLGYRLVDLDRNAVCVSWGDGSKRTPRMVAWSAGVVRES